MSGVLLRLRWQLAPLLDRLSGFCWADLVMWANGNDRVLPERSVSMCKTDVARCGECYCGKLRGPGAGS